MLIIKKFNPRKDIKFLYSLRNNIKIRKFFFKKTIVDYLHHLTWAKNILKNNIIFIVLYNQTKIGYVRYTTFKNEYYISVAIHPKFRKKGFMKRAILESEKSGITSKNRKSIYAEVLKHNKSSVKFFQSCGYKLKTINNQRIILKKLV